MSAAAHPFRRFNSLPEVIRLVVLMYVRFPLSLRNGRTRCSSAGSIFAPRRYGCGGNRFGPVFAARSGASG
jgi:putative transposase